MLKYFLILILTVSLSSLVVANEGISFLKLSYEEALIKAKKESKLLFIYFGNDEKTDELSFRFYESQLVANFYNKNFINIKLDLASEMGSKLPEKYYLNNSPFIVFVNNEGAVLFVKQVDSHDFWGLYFVIGEQLVKSSQNKDKRAINYFKGSHEEAITKAKAENKGLLMFFENLESPDLVEYANELYSQPMVADYINENYVNVLVDHTNKNYDSLIAKYEFMSTPDLLMLDSDGSNISDYTSSGCLRLYLEESELIERVTSQFFVSMLDMEFFHQDHKGENPNFFKGGFDEALAKAQQEAKPLVVICTWTRCTVCRFLAGSMRTKFVKEFYEKEFVLLELEEAQKDKLNDFMLKYGGVTFPQITFISPKGEVIKKFQKGLNKNQLLFEGEEVIREYKQK